jgi:twitching motility two-component system response regulator PilH
MATIMIVDDQKTDRELAGRVAVAAGHNVVYVDDGAKAVEEAIRNSPKLVLMDVVMPGMNGFNACRALKQNPATASIPVVLVTTKSAETDKFWGKKQGADEHIAKPFSAEALRAVIDRLAR